MRSLIARVGLISMLFLSALALAPAQPDVACAELAENSVTFYSSSSDGMAFTTFAANHSTYQEARDAAEADSTDNDAYDINVSQWHNVTLGRYGVVRSFVFFDTSSLPDDAVITSATLSLYCISKDNDVDFDVVIQIGENSDFPHDPLENGDYYYGHWLDNGGSINTSNIVVSAYNDITLTDNANENWIIRTGTTKFCLRSSRDIDNVAPADPNQETVYFYGENTTGTPYPPKLVVSFLPPTQPTLYSPADGGAEANPYPTFEWTNASYADNHRLLVDASPPDWSGCAIDVTIDNLSENTYTPTTALPLDNYSWKVVAQNAEGDNESDVWTFINYAEYDIVLRWEDNDEVAAENATVTAYMPNYGTQENTVVDGSLENVAYPERPHWIKAVPADNENYWRGRIPTADNGTLTFWISGQTVTEYTFTLIDLTGWFGTAYDGKLILRRYHGENLMVVNEDYWGASLQCHAYLMKWERYELRVKGRNDVVMAIGEEIMNDDIDRTIAVYGLVSENALWINDNVSWSVARSAATGYITVTYEDNTGNTTNADLYIYDWDEALQAQSSFENSVWSYTWTGADNDEHYIIEISVTHLDFGSFAENSITMGLGAYEPSLEENILEIENILGNPTVGASELPLITLISFAILAIVMLSISKVYASTGMMVVSLIAAFLVWLGWLDIPMAVPILILVLGAIWKLTEGRTD